MWFLRRVLVLSLVVLAARAEPTKKQMFFDLNEVNLDIEEDLENSRRALIDPIDNIAYRLPNNTFPIHYDISLKTDIHAEIYEFSGSVNILFQANEFTNMITLHYRQINITKVDILNQSGATIKLDADFTLDEPRDFLVIQSPQNFIGGVQYRVRIEYDGILRTDNNGFYRSSYINSNGDKVWLATSKFESTNARHGFPCYDEPGIRAEYTVQMEHHSSYIALYYDCLKIENKT